MRFKLVEDSNDKSKGRKLFRDCLQRLRSKYSKYKYDIQLQFDTDKSALGKTRIVDGEGPKFIVILCEYHLVDSDEQIINTIYHELAHVLDMQDQINDGVLFLSDNGKWVYNKDAKVESHGKGWNNWAKELSHLAGSEITETGDSKGIDVYSDSHTKYAAKCEECGNVVEVSRITAFIQNCGNVAHGSGKYNWSCGKCGKKNWKIIKGNVGSSSNKTNTDDIEDVENEKKGKIVRDADYSEAVTMKTEEGLTVA